jgi:hypothetical protein
VRITDVSQSMGLPALEGSLRKPPGSRSTTGPRSVSSPVAWWPSADA